MQLFQKIVLGFALLLTLIGNTAPVGMCFADGSISIAGMNACTQAETPCDSPAVAHSGCACGTCRSEQPAEPHQHVLVDLDDIIQHAEPLPDAPELTAFAFCLFLEHFWANTPTRHDAHAYFRPPESPRRSLPSPLITGTLPLLA